MLDCIGERAKDLGANPGAGEVPKRTTLLFSFSFVLVIVWFVYSFLVFDGLSFIVSCCLTFPCFSSHGTFIPPVIVNNKARPQQALVQFA